jgi:hypothetical protein
MITIFLLCMALAGADQPDIGPLSGTDENGLEWHQAPGLLPVTIASELPATIEQSDYLRFLSDAWWPTNLSRTITRNLTGNFTA